MIGRVLATAAFVLVVIVGLVGCGQAADVRDDRLSGVLQDIASNAAAGDPVDLADVYDGAWTRVAIFPAYSTNDLARRTLGFDFDIQSTPSQSRDDSYVVVFADGDRVAKWFPTDTEGIGFGAITLPVSTDRPSAQAQVALDSFGDSFLDVSDWQVAP
jgi:hypothetical protein